METDRTYIHSTNIRRIQYEAPDMFITFSQGRRYRYKNVPEAVFQGALDSEDIGKFHYANIQKKFEYEECKMKAE